MDCNPSARKLFAYPGGKWPLRKQIISLFPAHTTYVDVFGGSASILLAKEPSLGEVFNDKNEDIVNFFRVVKHRAAELAEMADYWLHSRKMWYDIRLSTAAIDEIDRAFRFWVITEDSFGAVGKAFGTTKKGCRSVTMARSHLKKVSERLSRVHIEHLDAPECIRVYDAPDTFFYLDPPYMGTHGGREHYNNLTPEEWARLRRSMDRVTGRFLLSCNDVPQMRDLFKGFKLRTLSVPETLSRTKDSVRRKELLIANYKI